MKWLFLTWGTLVCVAFGIATYTGYDVSDLAQTNYFTPGTTHSTYHK